MYNREYNEGPSRYQVERMKYDQVVQSMMRELRRVQELVIKDEMMHIKSKKNEFYI